MGEEQQASQVAGEAASLRAVAWQRFLNGPGDGLGRRLYEPALSRAVRYDRCCAYFLQHGASGGGPRVRGVHPEPAGQRARRAQADDPPPGERAARPA